MVKREFARESPGILSRCQRVAGPSAFCFGPETDQRINNEPDILIRRGKCSRASEEERFYLARLCLLHRDGSGVCLDNFFILRYFCLCCVLEREGLSSLLSFAKFRNLTIFGIRGLSEMLVLDEGSLNKQFL